MNKHYVEFWPVTHNTASIAGDIARHLQVRQSLGSAVILAQQPVILLSAVRKHWIKLSKLLQTERARTLDPLLRAALTQEIELMDKLRFVAKSPHAATADVFFVEPGDLGSSLPVSCRTLYADTASVNIFEKLTQQIPSGSVIIQYGSGEKR